MPPDQDVSDRDPSSRSVTRCPASGSPALIDAVAEADVAGGVHGPLELDGTLPGMRCVSDGGPAGLGSGCGEAGQVADVQSGRQGLDAVAAEQDVETVEPGPRSGRCVRSSPGRARSAVPRFRGCLTGGPPGPAPRPGPGRRCRPSGGGQGSRLLQGRRQGGMAAAGLARLGGYPQAERVSPRRGRTGPRGRPWPATGAGAWCCSPRARRPPLTWASSMLANGPGHPDPLGHLSDRCRQGPQERLGTSARPRSTPEA